MLVVIFTNYKPVLRIGQLMMRWNPQFSATGF